MDLRISLDEQQAEQLQKVISRPAQSFWRSDALLRTVQTVAVVLGGCWVLVQFVLFQREQTQLDIEKTRLQVRLQSIEEKQRSADLVASQTYRFSAERSLSASYRQHLDSRADLYTVTYRLKVTNQSTVPFELSLWVLDWFHGEVRPELKKRPTFVEQIGYPANRWNPGSQTGGAVSWTQVGSTGSISAEAIGSIASPWDFAIRDVDLTQGGGLTGVLKPGQSYTMEDDYLVKGRAGTYVAFVQSLCFERCKRNDDLYSTYEYAILPPAPPQQGAAQQRHAADGASRRR
jgi:hypothetical protein